MKDDMAARLREWSVEAQLPETRESTVRMRAVNGLAIAADEIERLRAELVRKADELEMVTAQRDHARRIVCRLTKKTYRTLKENAILRRWDCFKEGGK